MRVVEAGPDIFKTGIDIRAEGECSPATEHTFASCRLGEIGSVSVSPMVSCPDAALKSSDNSFRKPVSSEKPACAPLESVNSNEMSLPSSAYSVCWISQAGRPLLSKLPWETLLSATCAGVIFEQPIIDQVIAATMSRFLINTTPP